MSKRSRRANAAKTAELAGSAEQALSSTDVSADALAASAGKAAMEIGGTGVGARSSVTSGPVTSASVTNGTVVSGTVISGTEDNGTPVTAFVPDDAVVRRTKDGWRVGSDDLPDLTCAMILADLLAAENGMSQTSPAKPASENGPASETGRLRATVGQLEHALATRIRVEQAIGVLAERHRIKPRQAFEQLREAARSRGRKVIDIAGDVVASATNPLLQLPDELSRPRSAPRRGARQPSGAQ
jgi:ANTAR domain